MTDGGGVKRIKRDPWGEDFLVHKGERGSVTLPLPGGGNFSNFGGSFIVDI